MNTPAQTHGDIPEPLSTYRSILLAVDSSEHSNRSIGEAAVIARLSGARITGAHVYAAKLHDQRFRQMEGGLPEQFREEQELERQRDVHEDLITRGLGIISDSYLDQVERRLDGSDIQPRRRALEGKNYRELVREANSGDYDLLILGALGLGRVDGSRLGSVCRRTARRSRLDTLVIKRPGHSIADGPIVVAVDGSAKAYGGLLTALGLAAHWQVPVKVVAAFDPYYHYVAFNRIAGVLSEEAGKVFRFQEQEKLHEEIIDSGLAKIYQGHLSVAASLGRERGLELETVLLDGKPHAVIHRYLDKIQPSLLVLGRTGVHADAELDIGGNAELLLEDAPCAVLLSEREYSPKAERLAAVSTSWTKEAEERMTRVPSFVRSMARMAILRYAQERNHTVITERLVEEATAKLMPGHAEQAMAEIVQAHDAGEFRSKKAYTAPIRWTDEATARLLRVKDLALRGSLSLRGRHHRLPLYLRRGGQYTRYPLLVDLGCIPRLRRTARTTTAGQVWRLRVPETMWRLPCPPPGIGPGPDGHRPLVRTPADGRTRHPAPGNKRLSRCLLDPGRRAAPVQGARFPAQDGEKARRRPCSRTGTQASHQRRHGGTRATAFWGRHTDATRCAGAHHRRCRHGTDPDWPRPPLDRRGQTPLGDTPELSA